MMSSRDAFLVLTLVTLCLNQAAVQRTEAIYQLLSSSPAPERLDEVSSAPTSEPPATATDELEVEILPVDGSIITVEHEDGLEDVQLDLGESRSTDGDVFTSDVPLYMVTINLYNPVPRAPVKTHFAGTGVMVSKNLMLIHKNTLDLASIELITTGSKQNKMVIHHPAEASFDVTTTGPTHTITFEEHRKCYKSICLLYVKRFESPDQAQVAAYGEMPKDNCFLCTWNVIGGKATFVKMTLERRDDCHDDVCVFRTKSNGHLADISDTGAPIFCDNKLSYMTGEIQRSNPKFRAVRLSALTGNLGFAPDANGNATAIASTKPRAQATGRQPVGASLLAKSTRRRKPAGRRTPSVLTARHG